MSLKSYCEKHNIDPKKAIRIVFGETGGLLPKARGYTGYMIEITDTSIILENEKFGEKKEIPFSSFSKADFGIGSGNLWLQCVVDDRPFIFCATRGAWKSPAAKLLMEKIGEHTEVEGMKEYKHFTGKLFIFYTLIN